MVEPAFFQVDTRLASLLGETYRSTEFAVKELVDNAWDADAEHIWITLPTELSREPLIVKDDGCGMTEAEVRHEYLKVARDRRTTKGEKTPGKKRPVKGRKGVGKFAGLAAAEVMTIESRRDGKLTRLTIPKTNLLDAPSDLEAIPLDIDVETARTREHGTTITLTEMNRRFMFPTAEVLRELLTLEYGREPGIRIFVNGEALDIDDLPGKGFNETASHEHAGDVRLRLRITEDTQRVKNTGIVLRVGNKIVGKPGFFGLDKDPEIPPKLLRRVCGEVEVPGLIDDVTVDWGGVVENSYAYQFVQSWVRDQVKQHIEATFKRDVTLARARLQAQIKRRLEEMPEHRRRFAEEAIERIMRKFYGESDERVAPIVGVVLDALERDEYWVVMQKINDARHGDVELLAEALLDFGLLEVALLCQQAHKRRSFLDELAALADNPATVEATMHKALERSLWVLGAEYGLLASNQQLASIIKRYTDKEYEGDRGLKRPDLLLAGGVTNRHVLIEFKRPSHKLTRDDEHQAEKYRDDLRETFQPLDIVLIGGSVSPSLLHDTPRGITHLAYPQLIARARTEVEWLLSTLTSQR